MGRLFQRAFFALALIGLLASPISAQHAGYPGFVGAQLPSATSPAAVGQQQFTSSGSFVVPAGVTLIHAVGIGGGDGGSASATDTNSGGGGGLEYKNNIAVTPGETLTITVDTSQSAIYRSGTPLVGARHGGNSRTPFGTGGATGFIGGVGATTTIASGQDVYGGSSATFTGNGDAGSATPALSGTGGAGLNPKTGAQTFVNTPTPYWGSDFGGGGGNNSTNSGGSGGGGVVRIIWGPGRAFPSTLIGDL